MRSPSSLRKRIISTCAAMMFIAAAPLLSVWAADTAEVLYADPFGNMDKPVEVQVVTVHPEDHESKVRDTVWFRAVTGSNTEDGFKPGGEIMVAVDSDASAEFFKKYGADNPARDDGYVHLWRLTGIFSAWDKLLKADPNDRLNNTNADCEGRYFIDCTTKGQFTESQSPSSSPSTN